MGGSLRRHKQAQPKIIKRKHKKGKRTGPKISQLNEVVFEEKIGHKYGPGRVQGRGRVSAEELLVAKHEARNPSS